MSSDVDHLSELHDAFEELGFTREENRWVQRSPNFFYGIDAGFGPVIVAVKTPSIFGPNTFCVQVSAYWPDETLMAGKAVEVPFSAFPLRGASICVLEKLIYHAGTFYATEAYLDECRSRLILDWPRPGGRTHGDQVAGEILGYPRVPEGQTHARMPAAYLINRRQRGAKEIDLNEEFDG